MSQAHSPRKTTLGLLGAALAGSVLLNGPVFAMQPLAQGYLVAAADGKAAEGKCGEGKCGAETVRAPRGAKKGARAEGKCGEGKCGEGKCGEGKCGDASFSRTDTDKNGLVSRAEFLAVAPTRAAEFDKIDTSHDGNISEAEAYEYLRATYQANGKPVPKNLFAKLKK
ncbi:HvfA family oxazolone/thioamide-modified RiPP metallophore [Cupriavidus cauae]|uniref:EF-hand domain-containing protein n=1 Tax=Cupriavidus cauae TaxID=2608999 RepID=A0A5M8AHW5_9BURK|nr:EF-hand domain-containing protein [Cupriavidus cauae]KAA6122963.1 EF-hand domain-containing protein [Cupriavidus cauae]